MEKIINSIIVLVFGLLTTQITQAQGTLTYLSNLGQVSTGNVAIGNDSWRASSFETGTNVGGYLLNSIQLEMTDASGSPSGFLVMLYSAIQQGEFHPGSSLGTLNGSTNPATGGIFTYTPASSMTLSSGTVYFIVLTAGTAVANGAYDWSRAGIVYNPSGGWIAPAGLAGADNYQSVNGSSWNIASGTYGQFAITATPIPEPSSEILLGLGGLAFLWHRRKAKTSLIKN